MALISSNLTTVRIVGTLLIIIFGAVGCSAPLVITAIAKRAPRLMHCLSFVQLALTALGAGVVISTALVHILPDGMDMLARGGLGDRIFIVGPNSTIPSDDDLNQSYPYGPMLMMAGMLVTYVIDGELHRLADAQQGATMKAHVTEMGMAVHSVLVGIAYGVMTTIGSLNTLTVALVIHQLCEGFAVGPVLYKGARTTFHAIVLISICVLALPLGIGVGVLAGEYGDPGSKSSNLAQGILSCLAAGMLMHVGAVEFLANLHNPEGHCHGGHDDTPANTDEVKPLRQVDGNTPPTADESPVSAAITNEPHGDNHNSTSASVEMTTSTPTSASTPKDGDDDMDQVGMSSVVVVGDDAGSVEDVVVAPVPTYLEDHPLAGRVVSHIMVLLGAASMAYVALYA